MYHQSSKTLLASKQSIWSWWSDILMSKYVKMHQYKNYLAGLVVFFFSNWIGITCRILIKKKEPMCDISLEINVLWSVKFHEKCDVFFAYFLRIKHYFEWKYGLCIWIDSNDEKNKNILYFSVRVKIEDYVNAKLCNFYSNLSNEGMYTIYWT